MDDIHTPTSAWLAFTLAFDASARHCQHLRAENFKPSDIGGLILRYLQGDTAPLSIALQGELDNAKLQALADQQLRQRISEALQWARSCSSHHLIGFDHPLYPPLLRDTTDAPPLLYAKGDLQALSAPALAVVGSRKASRQAIDHTRTLAARMAERGVAIVSGLARGVDAAAHEGALSVGGITIAVAATEPESVYPKNHADLAHRIVQNKGLVITEYPLGAPTLRWYFPKRNRIISGLCLGVLVSEAGLPSGTLTTATHALNQGREVMAIPGSVQNTQAKGCHALIKQGATLVETEQDILDTLAWPLLRALEHGDAVDIDTGVDNGLKQHKLVLAETPASSTEEDIMRTLGTAPATIDDLMTHVDCGITELVTLLGFMEIDGKITSGAGGRYTRC